LKRLGFQLPDAHAGQAKMLAHLLKRHGSMLAKSEPHPYHRGHALIPMIQPPNDPIQIVGIDQLVEELPASFIGRLIQVRLFLIRGLGGFHHFLDLYGLSDDTQSLPGEA
jgi:hypothetical protein